MSLSILLSHNNIHYEKHCTSILLVYGIRRRRQCRIYMPDRVSRRPTMIISAGFETLGIRKRRAPKGFCIARIPGSPRIPHRSAVRYISSFLGRGSSSVAFWLFLLFYLLLVVLRPRAAYFLAISIRSPQLSGDSLLRWTPLLLLLEQLRYCWISPRSVCDIRYLGFLATP